MRFTLILIALVLLGCKNDTQMITHPDMPEAAQNDHIDEWHFFPCSMGDDQAFIFLNTGISDAITTAPNSLVKLRLAYKSPKSDGLPGNEEFESVKDIEDRLEAFSKEADDWYVGRVTVGGHRIFYIYTSRKKSLWMDFVEDLGASTRYDLHLAYSNDPEHKGYRDELYPSQDDWQVITDLKVIESLNKQGDDGSEARKIDHWVYFDDKTASVEFIVWAENNRFTEEPEHSHETDDGKYCVRLFHQGSVTIGDISSHTIALRREAAAHGGDYDGWETLVLKSKE